MFTSIDQRRRRGARALTPGLLLVTVLLLLSPQTLRAQATDAVSFQGRLTTPGGTPVADGVYAVTFRLYETENGGVRRWQETHTVTTRGGVFSVLLGQETPMPLNGFEAMPYLTLEIDGEEMGPRAPVSVVPYALKSRWLDEAALVPGQNVTITRQTNGALEIHAVGGGAGGLSVVSRDQTLLGDGTPGAPLGLADSSVTEATLKDGSVTGAKVADGALLAGQNVTITRQQSGALEIAAVGGGTGGLTSVATDGATLAGDGTARAPLAVASPFVLTGSSPRGVVRGEDSNGNEGYLGGTYGAYGYSNRKWGYLGGTYGAYGLDNSGNEGHLGGSNYGAHGRHSDGNRGFLGSSDFGTYGEHSNGNWGFFGGDFFGAYGEHSNGNRGYFGGDFYAAYGRHSNGNKGYFGGSSYGVYGENSTGNWGVLGGQALGVYGRHNSDNRGYIGGNTYGVFGENSTSNYGYLGGTYGAFGRHSGGNYGYLGGSTYAVYGSSSSFAGYFEGTVHVTGTLSKGGGSFKIDHPQDPANKYLAHSFVESPDMMNIYNGNTTTDAGGYATVTLPAYFEALNRDFRYQLTVIGTLAQAIVADEIQGHRFVIRTDQPNVKVSWQVTGIRQDAWAEAHRIVVEEDKPMKERGYYLHPKLYGQPVERNVTWAQDPEGMQALQEMPARLEAEQRQMEAEQEQIEQERLRSEQDNQDR